MKITLDLKTLVTLGGILAMLSGFVYTTTLRLNNIEEQVDSLEERQDASERRAQRKVRTHKKAK
jgi:hypothetical protein